MDWKDLEKANARRAAAIRDLLVGVVCAAAAALLGAIGVMDPPSVSLVKLLWVVIAVVGFAGVGFSVIGGCHLNNLADELRDELCSQMAGVAEGSRERDRVRTELAARDAFITAYRPSQEGVEKGLRAAAMGVCNACLYLDDLYHKGLAFPAPDKKDPQASMQKSQKDFTETLAGAKERFEKAEAEFWRLWNLANDQGYELKKAWQPYAGVPWGEPKSEVALSK